MGILGWGEHSVYENYAQFYNCNIVSEIKIINTFENHNTKNVNF